MKQRRLFDTRVTTMLITSRDLRRATARCKATTLRFIEDWRKECKPVRFHPKSNELRWSCTNEAPRLSGQDRKSTVTSAFFGGIVLVQPKHGPVSEIKIWNNTSKKTSNAQRSHTSRMKRRDASGQETVFRAGTCTQRYHRSQNAEMTCFD